MAEADLYSDSDEAPPAPVEEKQPEAKPSEDAESAGEQTALLPKAIFLGKDLKVGSKCEFEIVGVHEDEVQVQYQKHDKAKSEPEDDVDQVPVDDEMASMME